MTIEVKFEVTPAQTVRVGGVKRTLRATWSQKLFGNSAKAQSFYNDLVANGVPAKIEILFN
jgi:hypothetical protein